MGRCQDISTRTPFVGSDVGITLDSADVDISTRTPLAGSDSMCAPPKRPQSTFQPALPLRGVTAYTRTCRSVLLLFQPALPLRGVTLPRVDGLRAAAHISTRTPLAGSDLISPFVFRVLVISTRTPLAGSDHPARPGQRRVADFNPHSPCGE